MQIIDYNIAQHSIFKLLYVRFPTKTNNGGKNNAQLPKNSQSNQTKNILNYYFLITLTHPFNLCH